MTILELSKGQRNNTNTNNTELSNTNPIRSVCDVDNDENDRLSYRNYFNEHLELEILRERYPHDMEVLDAILEMILDIVCSKRKTIRIAGDDKPINVVKSQFMKLNSGHVEYVMECMKNNTSRVRNMKQYLLATLYNAPLTMHSYYQAWVNNDMATGKL